MKNLNRDKDQNKNLIRIYYIEQAVEQYVKLVFDANSLQFKQMSGMKFTTAT